MKKIIAIIMVVMAIMAMAGCGATNTTEMGKAYTKVWTNEDKIWMYDPNTGEEWHLYNVDRIENYFNDEIVNLRTANDLNHEYYYCVETGEVWRDNIHENTFSPMEEKYTVVYSTVERV